jgi:hypothetical protein
MEQSTELKDFTLRMYKALSGGDFSFFERYHSQQEGVLSIGTDPNEWWEGYPTIAKVFKAQMETGVISLIAGAPQAYSEGSVGWVVDRPKFKLPDGTEIPVRMTSVFHKEGNDWKIVLSHISLGVRNEDAFGATLPTQ